MIKRCIFCPYCRKEKFFGLCATCNECEWDYNSEAWPLNWEPSIGNKNEIAIHIHDLMRKMPKGIEDPSIEREETMNKFRFYRQNVVDRFGGIKSDDLAEAMSSNKIVNGIKDSGDRTEFSTGAVRDIHAGKGRFDLLPWNAIWDVAKHCENGAFKYGERNVNKGIPQHSLVDSACRHLVEYQLGYEDEKHLVAACWNLLWALEQTHTHPEMLDIPWQDEITNNYKDEMIKTFADLILNPEAKEESEEKINCCEGCNYNGYKSEKCNDCVDGSNYLKFDPKNHDFINDPKFW